MSVDNRTFLFRLLAACAGALIGYGLTHPPVSWPFKSVVAVLRSTLQAHPAFFDTGQGHAVAVAVVSFMNVTPTLVLAAGLAATAIHRWGRSRWLLYGTLAYPTLVEILFGLQALVMGLHFFLIGRPRPFEDLPLDPAHHMQLLANCLIWSVFLSLTLAAVALLKRLARRQAVEPPAAAGDREPLTAEQTEIPAPGEAAPAGAAASEAQPLRPGISLAGKRLIRLAGAFVLCYALVKITLRGIEVFYFALRPGHIYALVDIAFVLASGAALLRYSRIGALAAVGYFLLAVNSAMAGDRGSLLLALPGLAVTLAALVAVFRYHRRAEIDGVGRTGPGAVDSVRRPDEKIP